MARSLRMCQVIDNHLGGSKNLLTAAVSALKHFKNGSVGLGGVSAGPVGDGIVERSIAHFRAADPEFGERVAQGVKERRG